MEQENRKKKWFNTLKFFAAYLVAAWTFLQFVDWVLIRYSISPHWVDILLWFFIGISPSLIIYLYHQERLSKRIIKLREKIFIPLNIILLILALYFGFGNSDLGATTKDISFKNSNGQLETKTITKEEFRIGVPIYGFNQITEDSTTSWMRYGIGKLLYEDLLQNKNLSPDFMFLTKTTTKIREASLFYDFYVDGSYQKIGNDYHITVNLNKARNGKIFKKETFKGPNVLKLIDDISVFITSEAGFVESNSLQYIDLPINEFISNSIPAIEAYVDDDYKKAYQIDKNFALAYLEEAKLNTRYSKGKLETQDIIDKAFILKNKLPLQKQLEVSIQRNLAYGNYEGAEEQVKLQLDVDPSNDFYNEVLFAIYGETKNIEDYVKASESLFEKDPNADSGLNLAIAAMVNGEEDNLLEVLKTYEIINPNITAFKLEPLILKGEINTAEELFNDLKLANPDNSNRVKPYDSIFAYLKSHKPKVDELEQFVGLYRSGTSEMIVEYWVENDRLIQYVKNQRMRTSIPAGPNAFAGGFINDITFHSKLFKDENGKIIGINTSQFQWRNTYKRLYWKLDKSILAANEAFENGDFQKAEILYELAIKNNPRHSYLPNILAHINYLKNNDSVALREQNQKFSGTYGPRKFWVEDGKFYYKRKGDIVDLVRVELLPISENRYMDLTRLGTIMTFEEENGGKLASIPYLFNSEKMEWELLDNEDNYYLKANN